MIMIRERQKGGLAVANRVEPVLIAPLEEVLKKERYVNVATVDYETGGPNINAISWIYAKDEKTLFFAVDKRSRMVKNIEKNPAVAISLIANETTYSISGDAEIKGEIEGIPLKLMIVKVSIKEVRDVMFYGSRISSEPKYDKMYDHEAAAKLDQKVMDALIKA